MKKRVLKWVVLSCIGLFTTLAIAIYSGLLMSLPALDGERRLSDLSAAVEITRDQHGIASIRGENELDVAQALGFIHAQERFFQMDLARRLSAGELSALFGSLTIELDKSNRLHRFRQRAKKLIDNLSAAEKRLLQRYVTGVN